METLSTLSVLLQPSSPVFGQIHPVQSGIGLMFESVRRVPSGRIPCPAGASSATTESPGLEFTRISLFLRSDSGCPVPTFQLENFPTLSRLETEGRAVVIGGVMTLPPATNNPRQDAAAYLAKIKTNGPPWRVLCVE